MSKTPNARVTVGQIDRAAARLAKLTNRQVRVTPGGGGGAFAWQVSPSYGVPFGHIGRSKREALETLEALIVEYTPAVTVAAPDFAPAGESDYYRGQWEDLRGTESRHHADDTSACKMRITGDAGEATKTLDVTLAEARHILAYLSQNRRTAAAAGDRGAVTL